jgi:hypothetical protein
MLIARGDCDLRHTAAECLGPRKRGARQTKTWQAIAAAAPCGAAATGNRRNLMRLLDRLGL